MDRHGTGRNDPAGKAVPHEWINPVPEKIEIEFPEPLPISEQELALIETHMGAIIAAMMEPDPAHECEAA